MYFCPPPALKINRSTIAEFGTSAPLAAILIVIGSLNLKQMSIMLGNLSVNQIEKRLGIEFSEEIKEFMGTTHESNASNVPKGKWHCFDIPFNLVCGDIDVATKIYNSVKDRGSECKEALHFSLSGQ